MKDGVEFFLSTESNKFVYQGSCKVYLNTESKLLLIEPEDEDIKILKIHFCNSFVPHKNLLIHYSSNDSSENVVLSFSTEKDCKEIHLGILKQHQVTVKQEFFDDDTCIPSLNETDINDILNALDDAIKRNSNASGRLKRGVAQMLNHQPSQKEVVKSEFSSFEVQTNQDSQESIQSPVDGIRSRKRKYSSSDEYKKEKQCKLEITELDDVSSEVPTFELSFDDNYSTTTTQSTFTFPSNLCLQHSIPAKNVDRVFFPTWMNVAELRRFHRKNLPQSLLQSLSAGEDGFIKILSADKHIKEINIKSEPSIPEYENDCPYRDVSALSASKNGTLLFFEYSEEHPPLLNQPGMASKIRNYYKKVDGEASDFQLDFGETSFTQNFPYLGTLKPGQHLRSLENNMFCAPIFQQKFQSTDYLLIINENGLLIRKCSNLFVVGQECPLQEVPNPISKKTTDFCRNFLLVFIYRLFWASADIPRRLKMEDIREAFPDYPESSVRKRLKMCATFIRTRNGLNTNYWALKEDFCLPTEEEMMKLITPEMCCAYYSMMSSKQRLTDAGYASILANINDEKSGGSDDDVKIEDEIQCAPWNTTKAFLTALQGKCYLDRRGTADPTGCGEAFSYIRKSSKWTRREETFGPQKPQLYTGTNADLRKLPIKEAREICKEYGFPEEAINALSRWKVIDLIRKISIQEAKNGADLNGIARFARSGIRLTQMQQNWREYCQTIFDLQNQSLSNNADLSSDDDNLHSEDEQDDDDVSIIESENDESDGSFASTVAVKCEPSSCFDDEFGPGDIFGPKDIFGPAKNGIISFSKQQNGSFTVSKKFKGNNNIKIEVGNEKHFNESKIKEESRQSSESHQPTVSSDNRPSTSAANRIPESLMNFATINDGDELVYGENCRVSRKSLQLLLERENNDKIKKLKIVRTFRDSNGHKAIRSEVISNPKIIDAYIKIRTTKDIQFIKEYSYNDEIFKKENRKKIRRYQDQLRRIKRNEERRKLGIIQKPCGGQPLKDKKPPKEFTMKCSSCGGIGHMKTNKNCPFYSESGYHQAKPTIGQLIKNETDELTQVEETKVRIKKSALSLKLRISKNVLKQSKKDGK